MSAIAVNRSVSRPSASLQLRAWIASAQVAEDWLGADKLGDATFRSHRRRYNDWRFPIDSSRAAASHWARVFQAALGVGAKQSASTPSSCSKCMAHHLYWSFRYPRTPADILRGRPAIRLIGEFRPHPAIRRLQPLSKSRRLFNYSALTWNCLKRNNRSAHALTL